jgi:hypothetical protein
MDVVSEAAAQAEPLPANQPRNLISAISQKGNEAKDAVESRHRQRHLWRAIKNRIYWASG